MTQNAEMCFFRKCIHFVAVFQFFHWQVNLCKEKQWIGVHTACVLQAGILSFQ